MPLALSTLRSDMQAITCNRNSNNYSIMRSLKRFAHSSPLNPPTKAYHGSFAKNAAVRGVGVCIILVKYCYGDYMVGV